MTDVLRLPAETIVGVFGPLTRDHSVEVMVAPPLPVALPVRVVDVVGRVIVCVFPALTVGDTGLPEQFVEKVNGLPLLSVALAVMVWPMVLVLPQMTFPFF